MADYDYSIDELNNIETYRQYIEDTYGIDADEILNVDGTFNVDEEIFTNEDLLLVYKIAFLNYLEVIYGGTTMQSIYAAVGADADIDEIYDYAVSVMGTDQEFFYNLVRDNTGLLSMTADTDGDASTVASDIDALINTYSLEDADTDTDSDSEDSSELVDVDDVSDKEAEELMEELGLSGWWEILKDDIDGNNAVIASIMNYISYAQEAIMALNETIATGDYEVLDSVLAEIDLQNLNIQTALSFLPTLQTNTNSMLEFTSNKLKEDQDNWSILGRNLNISA